MRTWRPPADPGKPNCPYRPGFIASLKRHSPPSPRGHKLYIFNDNDKYGDCGFGRRELLETMTQSELVRQHPNRNGPDTLAESGPSPYSEAQMTITRSITFGNARGAHIASCIVSPLSRDAPFTATAKIYDPMYYGYSDPMVWEPDDVCCTADRDYSREAAAYEHLASVGETGKFAPAYYGSWTFDLSMSTSYDDDTGQTYTRSIRCILMENLEAGATLYDLYARNGSIIDRTVTDAFHYSEDYRINVMIQLMESTCRLIHKGLDQRDRAPRNVVVVPDPRLVQAGHESLANTRVVLIDYNMSLVFPRTTMGKHPAQKQCLPPNPLQRYWDGGWCDEFVGWVPPAWLNKELWHAWLLERYDGKRMQQYAPLSEEFIEDMHRRPQPDTDDEEPNEAQEET